MSLFHYDNLRSFKVVFIIVLNTLLHKTNLIIK